MLEAPTIDLGRVAQDLQFKRKQVESVVELLDAGNTVPFITRYRKEQTGNLDEEQIRRIQHRVTQLRQLNERRQTILRSLESAGKLTEELRAAILAANTPKRLEDLYLPHKPKKQTLATIARERGLGPLAEAVWANDPSVANLEELLPGLLDPEKQLNTAEDVLTGVQYILAEKIAEDAEVREAARKLVWQGRLRTTRATTPPPDATPAPMDETQQNKHDTDAEFRNYFDFSEPVRQAPPHRILAINRGERVGALKVRLEIDRERLWEVVCEQLPLANHPHRSFLEKCVIDALERLLIRSLEREVRGELTDVAEYHAVGVFARNLRNLLLQPPVHGKRVLAIDPGYRTGCKFAVLDEIGNLLDQGVVYPHVTRKKKKKRKPAPGEPTTEHDSSGGSDDDESPEESAPAASGVEESADEAAPPVDSGDEPALPADSYHRSTEPEGEPHGSLEPSDDSTNPSAESPIVEASAEPSNEPSTPADENNVPIEAAAETVASPQEETAASPSPEPQSPPAERTPIPPPISKRQRAKQLLAEACRKHHIDVIAIGNGSACRETEELCSELIAEELPDVAYCIVNEAGASVYSASAVGREEFPEFDATLRGTISIGRRLQDPLSELVKIDPQNLGIGMYQHDISPKLLRETLSEVVESCVNYVGVDVNTASVPLLQYISGFNQLRAKNVAEYRKSHGPFKNLEELKEVAGVGPAVFTQAAGFLRVQGGDQPFDGTWIHPESYLAAAKVLEILGYEPEVLSNRTEIEHLRHKTSDVDPRVIAEQLSSSPAVVEDILADLSRPGRDPREDLPPPIFRTGVLKIEDLTEGMHLRGTVLNVVDFGVFVDVGLKDSGLVHISQLANRYVRSPHDLVAVGDIVTTWVLKVDRERRRVSLTMIEPGSPPQQSSRPPRRRPEHQGQPRHAEANVGDRAPAPGQDQRGGDRRDQGQGQGQGQRPGGNAQARRRRPQGQGDQGGRQPQRRGRRGDHRDHESQDNRQREPKKAQPPVQLSPEALEGKEVLHTFGELKALFEHKKKDEPKGRK